MKPTAEIPSLYFQHLAARRKSSLTARQTQHLLYWAQGFWLALHDEPLFDNLLIRGQQGPTIVGLNPSALPRDFRASEIPNPVRRLLQEVYSVYGQFSDWRLQELTLESPPCQASELGKPINQELLASYCKTQLK